MEEAIVAGERLLLHPERAAFWPARRILLVADLHLGKGAHFRQAGIAVPLGVADRNFSRLDGLIAEFSPARVLLLGDLFHSIHNHVWDAFCAFTHRHAAVAFELVPGNHDILPPAAYACADLKIQPLLLNEGPFALTHHPLPDAEIPPGQYYLCGHVHPCVRLVDAAGGSMKLPTFFFGARGGILPAFGEFTGCAEVRARPGDRAFVLVEGRVLAVA